jgi:hypothetical protein
MTTHLIEIVDPVLLSEQPCLSALSGYAALAFTITAT